MNANKQKLNAEISVSRLVVGREANLSMAMFHPIQFVRPQSMPHRGPLEP